VSTPAYILLALLSIEVTGRLALHVIERRGRGRYNGRNYRRNRPTQNLLAILLDRAVLLALLVWGGFFSWGAGRE
jgi:hypothetical protein